MAFTFPKDSTDRAGAVKETTVGGDFYVPSALVDPDGTAVSESNPFPVRAQGSNEQVYDGVATWADSAAAGTVVNLDITLPTVLQSDAKYQLVITNPSTETAISVAIKNKETFGTTAKYPQVTTTSVASSTSDGTTLIVEGWLLGEAGRLSISNDTALTSTGGFTAEVRVRKL